MSQWQVVALIFVLSLTPKLRLFSGELYGLAMSDSDESDSFYSDPRRIFAKLLPEEKRPVAYLTPNEAAITVEQARNELFLIYDRLHHVVQLHESTIRKRWMKVRTLAHCQKQMAC